MCSSLTGVMISMPLTQVAGIRLVVDLKQIAASFILQMCIRQAGILCLRWNPCRAIMSTATMNWLVVFTASFMLMKQQRTMGIVGMVILPIMCKTRRSLKTIMNPERTAYMVCLARMSKILIIEVRLDTTGLWLISIRNPTVMVNITEKNTQWLTFFMGLKGTMAMMLVFLLTLLCTMNPF